MPDLIFYSWFSWENPDHNIFECLNVWMSECSGWLVHGTVPGCRGRIVSASSWAAIICITVRFLAIRMKGQRKVRIIINYVYIMRCCYRIPLINLNWMNEVWDNEMMRGGWWWCSQHSLVIISVRLLQAYYWSIIIILNVRLGTSLRVPPGLCLMSVAHYGGILSPEQNCEAYIKVGCHPPTTHRKSHYT